MTAAGKYQAPPVGPSGVSPAPINVHVKVEGSLINERELARVIQQTIARNRLRNPSNRPRET